MKIKYLIIVLTALCALNLATRVSAAETAASANPRSHSPEGTTVTFGTPHDGDVVPTTFTVKFLISGMGIAPAGSKSDDTGHHHLLIDVTKLPPMDQPLPMSDQLRHSGKGQTSVELTLAEGEHSLQLLFADYAHVPHDPVILSEKIHITVSADAVAETAEK